MRIPLKRLSLIIITVLLLCQPWAGRSAAAISLTRPTGKPAEVHSAGPLVNGMTMATSVVQRGESATEIATARPLSLAVDADLRQNAVDKALLWLLAQQLPDG